MITSEESLFTIDKGEFYIILPTSSDEEIKEYALKIDGKVNNKQFEYSSGTNNYFLSSDEIKKLIKKEGYLY